MRFVSLFLLILFINCNSYDKIISLNQELPQFPKRPNNVFLRKDGIYSLYDTSKMECGEKTSDHYTIYSPLVVLNDTVIKWSNYVGHFDNQPLKLDYYERFKTRTGNYVIKEDTLFAKIPITLYSHGMRQKIYEAFFQGIIKNNDTILNWQLIPPYPKANKTINNNFNFLKTPHMLFFMESKELLGLDSLYQQEIMRK